MNIKDLIHATAQPYTSLPRNFIIGGVPVTSRSLAFNMEAQTESNWCWAATATSVSHFYWGMSTWTQCSVASNNLSQNCCQSPDPCNVYGYLDQALSATQNYVSVSGPIAFSQVQAEIDAGRPVGARIGWAGGGGHFVCIYGYSTLSGVQYFDIDDPIYGKSHLSVADFSSHYQGDGTWTNAYLTKSFVPSMNLKPLSLKDEVLQKISEARNLLHVKSPPIAEAVLPKASGGVPTGTTPRSLGLAHEIYSLGLQGLAGDHAEPKAVGLRVLEFEGTAPQALYDVPSSDTAHVRQMSASSPYLTLFQQALDVVGALPDRPAPPELRLLRAPALNFEAIWIHGENASEDQVIPLRGFHGFTPMKPVSYQDSLERLHQAAATIPRDENMGG